VVFALIRQNERMRKELLQLEMQNQKARGVESLAAGSRGSQSQ